ncbi:geranylgeranyl pyrophosphate synthase-like [Zerene cesonia]|uniref:geranylgeranyl pyrophosphate synthase-like n=1 Tax=Zerene cesonia TaxID=33412 RepID=UPI0018E4DEBD|nr:geranylgeranyl pyrophosphate synthase-like [Zerene cesonia]
MSVKESHEKVEKNGELYLEKELLAPYTHIMKVRGKELRKRLPTAFNEWFKLPADKAEYIIDAVHMLHNGTLLFDDIQDNTMVRHGLPAAHIVYGLPLALNSGIHVIALVLQNLLKLGHPQISIIFSEEFLEIVRGQGSELYWRDNLHCPTQEQYEHVLKQKSGNMFRLAIRLMQLFSDYEHDLSDLALTLGMYFQFRDDYCNLAKEEAVEEWPEEPSKQPMKNQDSYCDDLTEGKFTLPIIHALKTSEGHTILNILRQHTRDYQLKKFCVDELERLGSMKYTRERLQNIDKYIRAEVKRLGGNPKLISILDEMFVK